MIANSITLFRLVLLVVFVATMLEEYYVAGLILFIVAWGLDAIDGFVARRFRDVTAMGSFLDKLTDRILIVSGCFLVVGQGLVPPWALLILLKDVLLIPTPFVHARREEATLATGWEGKLTTVVQGIAMIWLLLAWPRPYIPVALAAFLGAYVAFRHWQVLLKG